MKTKAKVYVVGPNRLQAKCECSWAGLVFSGDTSLVSAMEEAGKEVATHTCPPKPKKARAKKVKK